MWKCTWPIKMILILILIRWMYCAWFSESGTSNSPTHVVCQVSNLKHADMWITRLWNLPVDYSTGKLRHWNFIIVSASSLWYVTIFVLFSKSSSIFTFHCTRTEHLQHWSRATAKVISPCNRHLIFKFHPRKRSIKVSFKW